MSGTMARGIFVGRLTRDGELKFTNGGMAVLSFCIATDHRKKDQNGYTNASSFWDVAYFGKPAEGIAQYMTKGKLVAVDGELYTDTWEKDGQKHSRTKVNASAINLLGGGENKPASDAHQGNVAGNAPSGTLDDFSADTPF